MIGVIDFGMGNLSSILNSFRLLDIPVKLVDKPEQFSTVSKLILPGVGAYGQAMENIKNLNFLESLQEQVLIKKKPILGICLGMQLLLTNSLEHGNHQGLNFIPGKVKPLADKVRSNPVPHMGWNDVIISNDILQSQYEKQQESIYYFVHNYYCDVNDNSHVIGTTNYEFEFASMIARENIFGVQFHPEKSQKAGLGIFSAFNNL
jgi:glutamine amidotransferase